MRTPRVVPRPLVPGPTNDTCTCLPRAWKSLTARSNSLRRMVRDGWRLDAGLLAFDSGCECFGDGCMGGVAWSLCPPGWVIVGDGAGTRGAAEGAVLVQGSMTAEPGPGAALGLCGDAYGSRGPDGVTALGDAWAQSGLKGSLDGGGGGPGTEPGTGAPEAWPLANGLAAGGLAGCGAA